MNDEQHLPSWQELVMACPQLGSLLAECRAYRGDDPNGWYSRPGGLRDRARELLNAVDWPNGWALEAAIAEANYVLWRELPVRHVQRQEAARAEREAAILKSRIDLMLAVESLERLARHTALGVCQWYGPDGVPLSVAYWDALAKAARRAYDLNGDPQAIAVMLAGAETAAGVLQRFKGPKAHDGAAPDGR